MCRVCVRPNLHEHTSPEKVPRSVDVVMWDQTAEQSHRIVFIPWSKIVFIPIFRMFHMSGCLPGASLIIELSFIQICTMTSQCRMTVLSIHTQLVVYTQLSTETTIIYGVSYDIYCFRCYFSFFLQLFLCDFLPVRFFCVVACLHAAALATPDASSFPLLFSSLDGASTTTTSKSIFFGCRHNSDKHIIINANTPRDR